MRRLLQFCAQLAPLGTVEIPTRRVRLHVVHALDVAQRDQAVVLHLQIGEDLQEEGVQRVSSGVLGQPRNARGVVGVYVEVCVDGRVPVGYVLVYDACSCDDGCCELEDIDISINCGAVVMDVSRYGRVRESQARPGK